MAQLNSSVPEYLFAIMSGISAVIIFCDNEIIIKVSPLEIKLQITSDGRENELAFHRNERFPLEVVIQLKVVSLKSYTEATLNGLTRLCVYVYTYVYIYTCLYTHTYIFMCAYLHICEQQQPRKKCCQFESEEHGRGRGQKEETWQELEEGKKLRKVMQSHFN